MWVSGNAILLNFLNKVYTYKTTLTALFFVEKQKAISFTVWREKKHKFVRMNLLVCFYELKKNIFSHTLDIPGWVGDKKIFTRPISGSNTTFFGLRRIHCVHVFTWYSYLPSMRLEHFKETLTIWLETEFSCSTIIRNSIVLCYFNKEWYYFTTEKWQIHFVFVALIRAAKHLRNNLKVLIPLRKPILIPLANRQSGSGSSR